MTQKHSELGFLFFCAIISDIIIISSIRPEVQGEEQQQRRYLRLSCLSPSTIPSGNQIHKYTKKYSNTNTQIQIFKRHKQFYFYQENILKSPSGCSIKLMLIAEGCKDDTTVQLKVGFCKCFGKYYPTHASVSAMMSPFLVKW